MHNSEVLVWPVGERLELPPTPSPIVQRLMTTKRIKRDRYGLWIRTKY